MSDSGIHQFEPDLRFGRNRLSVAANVRNDHMTRAAPPPLNALRTFEAFARHRSMTRAAEELCVTHGAVSRQVAALQASMGVPLVTGPRHALTLTEAGGQLAERLSEGFGLIDDAVLAARHGQPREIEISCLGTVALKWLIPRLQDFLDAHPEVRVRLSESYRRVDFRRDRFDGAIRIIEPDQDMTGQEATVFMPQYQGPICSPAMAQSLTSMEALMRAPRLRSATFRRSWMSWAELIGVDLPPAAVEREFAHNHSMIEAAIACRRSRCSASASASRWRRGPLSRPTLVQDGWSRRSDSPPGLRGSPSCGPRADATRRSTPFATGWWGRAR